MNQFIKKVTKSGILLLCLIGSAAALEAQGLSGIWGVASDRTGAVIPGVQVTITKADTGAIRSILTDETGTYKFTLLEPGDYNLRAEKPGFKAGIANGVTLPVDETITMDV